MMDNKFVKATIYDEKNNPNIDFKSQGAILLLFFNPLPAVNFVLFSHGQATRSSGSLISVDDMSLDHNVIFMIAEVEKSRYTSSIDADSRA